MRPDGHGDQTQRLREGADTFDTGWGICLFERVAAALTGLAALTVAVGEVITHGVSGRGDGEAGARGSEPRKGVETGDKKMN